MFQNSGHIFEGKLLTGNPVTDTGGIGVCGDKDKRYNPGEPLEKIHPVPEMIIAREIILPPVDDHKAQGGMEQDREINHPQFNQFHHREAGQEFGMFLKGLRGDEGIRISKEMLQEKESDRENPQERLNALDPKRTRRAHGGVELANMTRDVN